MLSSNWLKGIKGCLVCGQNHLARKRHPPKDVREAIERLKNKNPHAMLSVDDLVYIADDVMNAEA